MRRLLLLPVALALAACGPDGLAIFETVQAPAIGADPPPVTLHADSPRALTATLVPGGPNVEIVRVAVRLNRDRAPALFDAGAGLEATADPVPGGGPASVDLPSDFGLVPGQLLSVQWLVDYRSRGSASVARVASAVVGTRLGCTDAQTTGYLDGLQAAPGVPAALESFGDISGLAALGYVPLRGFVSMRGMGVIFFHTDMQKPTPLVELEAALGGAGGALPRPSLLFYAPPAGAAPGTVTDGFPDFPYALQGIGLAAPYRPEGPPELGCMPREAWAVSEAGWFTASGGFQAVRAAEPAPGDLAGIPLVPPPPGGTVWHNRLWVVHLWFRSGAPPVPATCNPGPSGRMPADFRAGPGVAACTAATVFPSIGARGGGRDYLVRTLPP